MQSYIFIRFIIFSLIIHHISIISSIKFPSFLSTKYLKQRLYRQMMVNRYRLTNRGCYIQSDTAVKLWSFDVTNRPDVQQDKLCLDELDRKILLAKCKHVFQNSFFSTKSWIVNDNVDLGPWCLTKKIAVDTATTFKNRKLLMCPVYDNEGSISTNKDDHANKVTDTHKEEKLVEFEYEKMGNTFPVYFARSPSKFWGVSEMYYVFKEPARLSKKTEIEYKGVQVIALILNRSKTHPIKAIYTSKKPSNFRSGVTAKQSTTNENNVQISEGMKIS